MRTEPVPRKACPFCGGETLIATQTETEDGEEGSFQIECLCGSSGPKETSLTAAVDSWNFRKVAA